jgi:rhodanese-related sulfurtransferase
VSEDGYAGDVSPKQAWDMLEAEADAVLVDVRTSAEWAYVGITDLSSLDKEQVNVSWQLYPTGDVNEKFADEIAAAAIRPDQPVLFLCRSGVRSMHAAVAMTERGYQRCYNIAEGFEGGHDAIGHRGSVGGWKVAGLPWRQA